MNIGCLIFLLSAVNLYAFELHKKLPFGGFRTSQSYISNVLKSFPHNLRSSSIQTKWIEQPLDHFDSNETHTWKMKYFQNLKFFKPGGPIFLFIGGESRIIIEFLLNNVLMYQMAKENNGAMFASEHRFYGESKPSKNLKYCSSRQALADLAHLIKTLKKSNEFRNSKVVVVGGSYAGNLAAWMRVIYPELVDMAHASSAPVLAKENFHEYYEKVAQDFLQFGSQACVDKISETIENYQKIIVTPDGKKQLNICEDNDMTIPENQQYFFTLQLFQYAWPTLYSTPQMIKDLCADLQDPKSGSKSQNDSSHIVCISYDFEQYTETLPLEGESDAWLYQTCTEFGYFLTSISDRLPFKRLCLLIFMKKFVLLLTVRV